MKKNSTSSMIGKPFELTSIKDEHLIQLDALCTRLNTDLQNGMADVKAKNILRATGKNELHRPKKRFSFDFTGYLGTSRQNFSRSEWKRLFGHQIPNDVTVIRDGEIKHVSGKRLVVGDLVELNERDIVPADIRIISSDGNVIVDNRLITGKPLEPRNHREEHITQDVLLTPNMVFACTQILGGSCIGIVLRTGEDTVFGKLTHFAQKVKIEKEQRKHSLQ